MTRFVLLMALVSLAFMLGMKKGMSLKSTSEIPAWRSSETILPVESLFGPDITVTILDQNGKPVTGAVTSGEQEPR
jgi:hypothetical protein